MKNTNLFVVEETKRNIILRRSTSVFNTKENAIYISCNYGFNTYRANFLPENLELAKKLYQIYRITIQKFGEETNSEFATELLNYLIMQGLQINNSNLKSMIREKKEMILKNVKEKTNFNNFAEMFNCFTIKQLQDYTKETKVFDVYFNNLSVKTLTDKDFLKMELKTGAYVCLPFVRYQKCLIMIDSSGSLKWANRDFPIEVIGKEQADSLMGKGFADGLKKEKKEEIEYWTERQRICLADVLKKEQKAKDKEQKAKDKETAKANKEQKAKDLNTEFVSRKLKIENCKDLENLKKIKTSVLKAGLNRELKTELRTLLKAKKELLTAKAKKEEETKKRKIKKRKLK